MAATIIRLPQVRTCTGLSRSSIYQKIKEGTFPAPINLGKRSVGWIESEVNEWVDARIAASRPEHTESAQ